LTRTTLWSTRGRKSRDQRAGGAELARGTR
jgi:hypothetical protein